MSKYQMSDFSHDPLEKIVKPRIYIAGPYTNKDSYKQNNNIDIAEQVGKQFARHGLQVYVPHVATKNWDDVNNYNYFMDLHLGVLKDWATDIVMLDGWVDSKGSVIEFKEAHKLGKHIWYEIRHYLNKK